MAFTADTRNHFLREAKREYTERRNSQIVHKWRTPLWRELTEQQREEWAQYMHDEWLKRPNPPGLRKPDWNIEAAEFSPSLWNQVIGRAFRPPEPPKNMRCTHVEVETEQKPVDLGDMVVTRWVTLAQHTDLANTLEQRIAELTKRVELLEQPQIAAPMVMEVKLHTSEVQTAINDTLAEIEKVKIEVGYLRKQKKWLQDTHAEQFKLLQKRNSEIEDLKKECDARKQDEVKLRQSIEALAQDLHAERNKAKPYIIYGNNLAKLYQAFGEGWYEKHVSTHNLHIIYMTGAQYDRVKALADLFEV